MAPDGSRALRRLPRAADAGICSACLDAHSNCVLAGAPRRLGRGGWRDCWGAAGVTDSCSLVTLHSTRAELLVTNCVSWLCGDNGIGSHVGMGLRSWWLC